MESESIENATKILINVFKKKKLTLNPRFKNITKYIDGIIHSLF